MIFVKSFLRRRRVINELEVGVMYFNQLKYTQYFQNNIFYHHYLLCFSTNYYSLTR